MSAAADYRPDYRAPASDVRLVRLELPADLAAERYTFRAVLARLQANGAPMTHSAHIADGHLCILRCSAAKAASYAAALAADIELPPAARTDWQRYRTEGGTADAATWWTRYAADYNGLAS